MCCAAQPPQRPNQGQIGAARPDAAFSVSTSSARLPSLTSARSPGRAKGTIVPSTATPWPSASRATIATSSSGSAMARGDEEFARPRAAGDRRGDEAEHGPAISFDRRAHTDAGALERRFSPDPALDEIAPFEFELRLDEADEPGRARRELQHLRQDQPLGNEAHVDDNGFRRLPKRLGRERARVEAFERADARIGGEARIELSAADIDGDDPRGAAREQNIGEASGRGADVE